MDPTLTLPLSVSVWVNCGTRQADDSNIYGNFQDANNRKTGFVLKQVSNVQNKYIVLYGSGNDWIQSAVISLTAGVWQHVTVVLDAKDGITIYVCDKDSDSVPGGTKSTTNRPLGLEIPIAFRSEAVSNPADTVPFQAGNGQAGITRTFTGQLCDLRVYTAALDAEDALTIATEGRKSGVSDFVHKTEHLKYRLSHRPSDAEIPGIMSEETARAAVARVLSAYTEQQSIQVGLAYIEKVLGVLHPGRMIASLAKSLETHNHLQAAQTDFTKTVQDVSTMITANKQAVERILELEKEKPMDKENVARANQIYTTSVQSLAVARDVADSLQGVRTVVDDWNRSTRLAQALDGLQFDEEDY
jgi:hypothetical protein